MSINDIYNHLCKCGLMKKWRRYLHSISCQIFYVSCNLKTGYLWDQGPSIGHTLLVNVVDDLKNRRLISNKIIVVEVSRDATDGLDNDLVCSDIFIINKFGLVKRKSSFILVDISAELSQPTKINCTDHRYDDLVNFITDSIPDDDVDKGLALSIPPSVCGCSVLGYLIGYPVIYWYRRTENNQNCLQFLKLKIFQAFRENVSILSFSIPEQMWVQDLLIQKEIDDWTNAITIDSNIRVEHFDKDIDYVAL